MATSTLIQRLVAGETGAEISNRREVETFLASAAIVAGDWVMFDTAKTGPDRVLYVKQATVVALGNTLVVGVALDAASAAGQKVRVVTSGYVEGANVATAVTIGQPITVGAVVGQGRLSAAADLTNCHGIALEGAASNTCDVWVLKSY